MALFRCEVLTLISHLLLVLNSSTNILIYSWKDTKFRQSIKRVLFFGKVAVPAAAAAGSTAASPTTRASEFLETAF